MAAPQPGVCNGVRPRPPVDEVLDQVRHEDAQVDGVQQGQRLDGGRVQLRHARGHEGAVGVGDAAHLQDRGTEHM